MSVLLVPHQQAKVINDVLVERDRQDEKWGPAPDNFLERPDGTTTDDDWVAEWARQACEIAAAEGKLTWRHILSEEVGEAYAESDPEKLYAELIQVAAVAVAWAETIKARP